MSQRRSPSPASRSENVLPSLAGPQTPTNLQPALLPDSDINTERFISRGQTTDSRDGLTQREYDIGHLSGMETSVLSEHQSSMLSDVTKPAPIPIPQPSGQQNPTYKPAAVQAEKTVVEVETHTRNAGTHVDPSKSRDYFLQNVVSMLEILDVVVLCEYMCMKPTTYSVCFFQTLKLTHYFRSTI